MLITRTTDGDLINRIVNDPRVRQGPLDLGPLVRDSRCYALVGEPPEWGTHMCLRIIEGVYEVHSTVLPEGQGEWAVELTEAAIRYLFCTTECIEIITKIPQGSPSPTALARRFGLKARWMGNVYTVWSLTMMEWMPPDIEDFQAVIAEMEQADQATKARFWQIRREFVTRQVN